MTERRGFLSHGSIKRRPTEVSRLNKYQLRAVNEARTRDPQLGKLMLYQLSYYRICFAKLHFNFLFSKSFL